MPDETKLINPINAIRTILKSGKERIVVADEVAEKQVQYKVIYPDGHLGAVEKD